MRDHSHRALVIKGRHTDLFSKDVANGLCHLFEVLGEDLMVFQLI